jgi:hypothetical protein
MGLNKLRDIFFRTPQRESQRTDIGAELEKKFNRLAHDWRDETYHLSSITQMVLNSNYQRIIGMGPAVLPMLFNELKKEPDHWFWALRAITEEDPTRREDAGDLEKMRAAWLDWAKEKGYV